MTGGRSRERGLARVRSYELLQDSQGLDVAAQVDELMLLAEQRQWHDVMAILHYARFAHDEQNSGEGATHAARMLEAAERSADDAVLATALAVQVLSLPIGTAPFTMARSRDLPQAVAMLRRGGGSAVDRPAALITCGLAYHRFGLWELARELFDEAETELAAPLPVPFAPITGMHRVALSLNRREAVLAEACALAEIGRRSAAQHLCVSGSRVEQTELAAMPVPWRPRVLAVAHLLAALAGHEHPGSVDGVLRDLPEDEWTGYRSCVLLAEAVRAFDRGDVAGAAELAEQALDQVDEDFAAVVQGLCMALACSAEVEDSGWRRYAEHQRLLRWQNRVALLRAARVQLEAERVMLSGSRG